MIDSQVQGGVVLDAENPWPGLHEFDERGRDFFNGRDEETATLLRLVRDAPLTVLFGRSGLGKTSLLEAGLFPRLRQEQYLPIYVRLDPRNRSAALIEQAAQALRRELDVQSVDHPPFEREESLWEYLHRNDLELWSRQNHLLTPVLVFDQFEELFTLGIENADAVRQLRTDLADLIENRIPGPLAQRLEQSEAAASRLSLQAQRYKVLLSFREDYLPEVEGWHRDIPSLARNRLRLLPMNGDQALEAVFKTGGRVVDEAVARDTVSFVAAARKELEHTQARAGIGVTAPVPAAQLMDSTSGEDLAIEPALLSLVPLQR